jgi:hypothetical protein
MKRYAVSLRLRCRKLAAMLRTTAPLLPDPIIRERLDEDHVVSSDFVKISWQQASVKG